MQGWNTKGKYIYTDFEFLGEAFLKTHLKSAKDKTKSETETHTYILVWSPSVGLTRWPHMILWQSHQSPGNHCRSSADMTWASGSGNASHPVSGQNKQAKIRTLSVRSSDKGCYFPPECVCVL